MKTSPRHLLNGCGSGSQGSKPGYRRTATNNGLTGSFDLQRPNLYGVPRAALRAASPKGGERFGAALQRSLVMFKRRFARQATRPLRTSCPALTGVAALRLKLSVPQLSNSSNTTAFAAYSLYSST